jgi:hypothetical protein
MAKYSIEEKADMLKRAEQSERKARGYASEERAYRNAEKNSADNMLGRHYKATRQAMSHMANMAEAEAEALKVRATNSRAQYEHEKAQGDPNATSMSYEEWKKL